MTNEVHAVSKKTDQYGNPICPHYFIEFEYDAGLSDNLVCWLEHEPSDWVATGEFGEPLEPRFDDTVTLCDVWLRGVNVFNLLSDEKIAEIEELALEDILCEKRWL